ncbi:MAG TPA: peptidylprolyl isomerase [Blastocatellia bacterium]|nr:peptidylprolyl isomerase [Blastocatellia bacterium]
MTHKKAPLILLIALLLSISSFSVSCGARKARTAVIETDLGNIKIELLEDDAPETVENFRQLAQRGAYDGTIFHRVISGFMIQGGDPKGDGSGGETASGKALPDETHPASTLYTGGYKRGYVAMANRGTPETGTSQFFIMHRDRPLQMLRPVYTIFGEVTEGMDVVDKIAATPTSPANNRPLNPIKMNKVTVQ